MTIGHDFLMLFVQLMLRKAELNWAKPSLFTVFWLLALFFSGVTLTLWSNQLNRELCPVTALFFWLQVGSIVFVYCILFCVAAWSRKYLERKIIYVINQIVQSISLSPVFAFSRKSIWKRFFLSFTHKNCAFVWDLVWKRKIMCCLY